jgi:hypothetical protein
MQYRYEQLLKSTTMAYFRELQQLCRVTGSSDQNYFASRVRNVIRHITVRIAKLVVHPRRNSPITCDALFVCSGFNV